MFIAGRVWRLVPGLYLALLAAPGHAEDFEAGKSPSAIFAADCSGCHRSPRGLAKGMSSRATLSGFLREHYTTGSGPASELASYLLGMSGEERRGARAPALGEAAPRPGEKPMRRRAQEAVVPPQTVPPPTSDRKRRWRGEAPSQAVTESPRRGPEGAATRRPRPAAEDAQAPAAGNARVPAAEARGAEPAPQPKPEPPPAPAAETPQPSASAEGRSDAGQSGSAATKETTAASPEIKREAAPERAVESRPEPPSREAGAEAAATPAAPASGAASSEGRGDQSAFSAPSP